MNADATNAATGNILQWSHDYSSWMTALDLVG
jgi:hypothetical protein